MKYLFYIEGLDREVWVTHYGSRMEAQSWLWKSLTDGEQNQVIQIELLDEQQGE